MSKPKKTLSQKIDRLITKRQKKQIRELTTIWIGVCEGKKSGTSLANQLNEMCHCSPSQSKNGLKRLSSCDEIPYEIAYDEIWINDR